MSTNDLVRVNINVNLFVPRSLSVKHELRVRIARCFVAFAGAFVFQFVPHLAVAGEGTYGSADLLSELESTKLWADFVRVMEEQAEKSMTRNDLRKICQDALQAAPMSFAEGIDACVTAALKTNSPSNSYVSPDSYKKRPKPGQTSGEIGVELPSAKSVGEPLFVAGIRLNGAAEKTGLQPGDVILDIDGKVTNQLTRRQAIELLDGEPHSEVNLRVQRGIRLLSLKVLRVGGAGLPIRTVRLNEGLYYIRISQLSHGAAQLFVRPATFSLDHNVPVVFDLRGNSGGELEELRAFVYALLGADANALMLHTNKGLQSLGNPNASEQAIVLQAPGRLGALLAGRKLFVLVDSGTAGGAEALAIILRNLFGATSVGTRTAGVTRVNTLAVLDKRALVGVQFASLVETVSKDGWVRRGVPIDVEILPSTPFCYGVPSADAQLDMVLTLLGLRK